MEDRWQLVLPHRDYLLRLALSKGVGAADAEDCVQEAMLRCVQYADLDPARVVPFLTTILTRLCADTHRARVRDERLAVKLTAYDGVEPPADERVCERAEAEWVSGHVAGLPERQRTILSARADGESCGEIAERMSVSYKVVESALSRARAHLRAALVASLGFAGLVARRVRGPVAAATSLTLVALGTAALVFSGPFGGGDPVPGEDPDRRRQELVDRAGGMSTTRPEGGRGGLVAARPNGSRRAGGGRSDDGLPVPLVSASLSKGPTPTDDTGPMWVVHCATSAWFKPAPPTFEGGCRTTPSPGAISVSSPSPSPSEGSA